MKTLWGPQYGCSLIDVLRIRIRDLHTDVSKRIGGERGAWPEGAFEEYEAVRKALGDAYFHLEVFERIVEEAKKEATNDPSHSP
jgi:hypothetical protein